MKTWIFFKDDAELAEMLAWTLQISGSEARLEQQRLRKCSNLHVRWLEDSKILGFRG